MAQDTGSGPRQYKTALTTDAGSDTLELIPVPAKPTPPASDDNSFSQISELPTTGPRFPLSWYTSGATDPKAAAKLKEASDLLDKVGKGQLSVQNIPRDQWNQLPQQVQAQLIELDKPKPQQIDDDEDEAADTDNKMWRLLMLGGATLATSEALIDKHRRRHRHIARVLRGATRTAAVAAREAEKAEREAKKAKAAAEAASKNAQEAETLSREAALTSRTATEAARAAERLKEAEKTAAAARREEEEAKTALEHSRTAERALLVANEEKAKAERALKEAGRLVEAADLAKKKLSGVRRLLSVAGSVGKYNLGMFAAVRVAKFLAVYALAPKGQSKEVTTQKALAVLTRSPFSDEATAEFKKGDVAGGIATVASDIKNSVMGTVKFAGNILDTLINRPDEVKTQLAAVSNELKWFKDLYEKDPAKAQAVAKLTLDGVLPTSWEEARQFAYGGVTGDQAATAEATGAIQSRMMNPELMGDVMSLAHIAQTLPPPSPLPRSLRGGQAPMPEPTRHDVALTAPQPDAHPSDG